jgi:hypothetical protein
MVDFTGFENAKVCGGCHRCLTTEERCGTCARIATLEAALAEAREDSKRLTWAWEHPEEFMKARQTTPPNLTGRQQIDVYRGLP